MHELWIDILGRRIGDKTQIDAPDSFVWRTFPRLSLGLHHDSANADRMRGMRDIQGRDLLRKSQGIVVR